MISKEYKKYWKMENPEACIKEYPYCIQSKQQVNENFLLIRNKNIMNNLVIDNFKPFT